MVAEQAAITEEQIQITTSWKYRTKQIKPSGFQATGNGKKFQQWKWQFIIKKLFFYVYKILCFSLRDVILLGEFLKKIYLLFYS